MPLKKFWGIGTFVLTICLLPGRAALTQNSAKRSSEMERSVRTIVHVDRAQYSRNDSMRIFAFIQNAGDAPIYVDRRMFWTGLGGGLQLEIVDEHGRHLPSRLFSDALMPPIDEADSSVLIRLEEGFFYGSSVSLKVSDFFPEPGKYSIRVTYKSRLRKESVQSQLQKLPALWEDTPPIPSEAIWIVVTN